MKDNQPKFQFGRASDKARASSHLRQSAQKECPHGSLTGLVRSPKQMPHSLVPSIIIRRRGTETRLHGSHWPRRRKAGKPG